MKNLPITLLQRENGKKLGTLKKEAEYEYQCFNINGIRKSGIAKKQCKRAFA
jgi:hypothetical protein